MFSIFWPNKKFPIVFSYLQDIVGKRSLQKVLMTDLHMTHEEASLAINEAKHDIAIEIGKCSKL